MNKKKGFTLIEILMALGIFSVIAGVIFSFLSMGIKSHSMIAKEYDIQSDMRVVSQTVNNVVREATATYIKNKDDLSKLTKGWNYIIYDRENKQIVQFTSPNSKTAHRRVVLADLKGTNDLEYNIEFIAKSKDMLAFNLYADISNNDNIQQRIIETELRAINTLGGIDSTEVGGIGKSGNTLAYSTRGMTHGGSTQVTNAPITAVSMVLDTSGSMKNTMGSQTRIQALKSEAKELLMNLNNIADEARKVGGEADIYVSLVPFSSNAIEKSIISMEKIPSEGLNTTIDGLVASGGTNTGDGMRIGLRELESFKTGKTDEERKVNNFMIILVDGETSMSSINKFEKKNPRPVRSDKIGTYVKYENYGGLSNEESINRLGQVNIKEIYYYDKPNDGYDSYGWYSRKNYFLFEGRKYYHNEYSLKYDVEPVYLMDLYGASSSEWKYSEVYYDEINPPFSWGRGNNIDYFSTIYTDKIGAKIKEFTNKEGENIKVYVIAFTDVEKERSSCEGIGISTGAQMSGSRHYFTAGSSDELKKVFEQISGDIKKTIQVEMGGDLSKPE